MLSPAGRRWPGPAAAPGWGWWPAKVWEDGGGTGAAGAMCWHLGMGAGDGRERELRFHPHRAAGGRPAEAPHGGEGWPAAPPGLGITLLPTAPSSRSPEPRPPQKSPFPEDPAGKPGSRSSPSYRSYINTRLVPQRARSKHHERFKSRGSTLTPGALGPAGRQQAGGQAPPPQLGPTEEGGDTQSRTDVTAASRGPSGLLHLVSTLCNTTCGGAGTAHACTPQQPNRGEKKGGGEGGKK